MDTPRNDALVNQWLRIQMIVRCGLSVRPADYVRLYLLIGHRIARRGIRAPGAAQLHMLRTLLHTAQDTVLPRSLRSACLEQAVLLSRQLEVLLGFHDPVALGSIRAAVRQARGRLVTPSRQA